MAGKPSLVKVVYQDQDVDRILTQRFGEDLDVQFGSKLHISLMDLATALVAERSFFLAAGGSTSKQNSLKEVVKDELIRRSEQDCSPDFQAEQIAKELKAAIGVAIDKAIGPSPDRPR